MAINEAGELVGVCRIWGVEAGAPVYFLGPLAVDPAAQSSGLGLALAREAVAACRAVAPNGVIVVGAASFFGQLGSAPIPPGRGRCRARLEAVYAKHQAAIDARGAPADRLDRLCELNVLEQVVNVTRTTVVQDAWARGQKLSIHGWVYGLHDGLLRDIGPTVGASNEVVPRYRNALTQLVRDAQPQFG